jgi:transposase-like protein
MEEWDPASNDFVFRCNSCWRTNKQTKKIIRTSREKYYCLDCLATFDLCQG